MAVCHSKPHLGSTTSMKGSLEEVTEMKLGNGCVILNMNPCVVLHQKIPHGAIFKMKGN